MNEKIIKNLKKLITLRNIENSNLYKINANKRAIESIESLDYEITSVKEAEKIKGVGKTIGKHIDDILKNNSLEEINNLDNNEKEKINIITELMEIQGLGFKRAEKYYLDGYTSNNLPKSALKREIIGNKYKEQLKKRVPRELITNFKEKLKNILIKIKTKNKIEIFFKITGSYRRELPNSGDIDIIIFNDDINDYKEKIIKKLNLEGEFSSGINKFEGIINLNDEYQAVKIDLIFLDNIDEYPYTLLYFTGNKILNTKMRAKARKLGMHLTNNKMLDENKREIIVANEKEIFEILEIDYLKPKERNL